LESEYKECRTEYTLKKVDILIKRKMIKKNQTNLQIKTSGKANKINKHTKIPLHCFLYKFSLALLAGGWKRDVVYFG
jgi:hypothetical protein